MNSNEDDSLPPVVAYIPRAAYFTAVRRMKAEKERGIPINQRSSFAISTKSGKPANEMSEEEWETFYKALCDVLKRDYPEQYDQLFDS